MVSKADAISASQSSQLAGEETGIHVVTVVVSAMKERFRMLTKRVMGDLT